MKNNVPLFLPKPLYFSELQVTKGIQTALHMGSNYIALLLQHSCIDSLSSTETILVKGNVTV